MKRLLFVICGLLITIASYAQQLSSSTSKADWTGIVIEKNIVFGVSFDLRKADLAGLSYKDRVDVDPELETDFIGTVDRCVSAANKEMKIWTQNYQTQVVFFSSKADGKEYRLHFTVKSVDAQGNTIADALVVTPNGIVKLDNLRGKGGKYGTYVNLMGDGFESLGKTVAKKMGEAIYNKRIKIVDKASR